MYPWNAAQLIDRESRFETLDQESVFWLIYYKVEEFFFFFCYQVSFGGKWLAACRRFCFLFRDMDASKIFRISKKNTNLVTSWLILWLIIFTENDRELLSKQCLLNTVYGAWSESSRLSWHLPVPWLRSDRFAVRCPLECISVRRNSEKCF